MNEINQNQDTYLLRNVLLETGFLYEKEEIVATKTALFDIQIEANKIKNIEPAQSGCTDAYTMYAETRAYKDNN